MGKECLAFFESKESLIFYMFPSRQDVEAFQVAFGPEAGIKRLYLSHLNCFGTQVAAVILPASTKDESLKLAWEVIRKQARWLILVAPSLPETERYVLIAGWSRQVRKLQGQIFKTGGSIEEVRLIADSPDWMQFEERSRQRALLQGWEKDVFGLSDMVE